MTVPALMREIYVYFLPNKGVAFLNSCRVNMLKREVRQSSVRKFKTMILKTLAQVLLKSQSPIAVLLESCQAVCLFTSRTFAY